VKRVLAGSGAAHESYLCRYAQIGETSQPKGAAWSIKLVVSRATLLQHSKVIAHLLISVDEQQRISERLLNTAILPLSLAKSSPFDCIDDALQNSLPAQA